MYLYHFTDRRNLASIKKYGLLSWPLLEQRGFHYYPGSNQLSRQLDEIRGVEEYVHLCTSRYHPMANRCVVDGRIRDLAWLIIDPTVMRWRSTLFSDDNASSARATIGRDPMLALDSDSAQAEVMVESALSPRWIYFG